MTNTTQLRSQIGEAYHKTWLGGMRRSRVLVAEGIETYRDLRKQLRELYDEDTVKWYDTFFRSATLNTIEVEFD